MSKDRQISVIEIWRSILFIRINMETGARIAGNILPRRSQNAYALALLHP